MVFTVFPSCTNKILPCRRIDAPAPWSPHQIGILNCARGISIGQQLQTQEICFMPQTKQLGKLPKKADIGWDHFAKLLDQSWIFYPKIYLWDIICICWQRALMSDWKSAICIPDSQIHRFGPRRPLHNSRVSSTATREERGKGGGGDYIHFWGSSMAN